MRLRHRYGIALQRIPITCDCGAPFNIQHALSCPKGGYIITRHNEIQDFTAELLREICHVALEPSLQHLTGEILQTTSTAASEVSRSDVSAKGVWIK